MLSPRFHATKRNGPSLTVGALLKGMRLMSGYLARTWAGTTSYGWSLSAKNVLTNGAKRPLQMNDDGVRVGRIDRAHVVVAVARDDVVIWIEDGLPRPDDVARRSPGRRRSSAHRGANDSESSGRRR